MPEAHSIPKCVERTVEVPVEVPAEIPVEVPAFEVSINISKVLVYIIRNTEIHIIQLSNP